MDDERIQKLLKDRGLFSRGLRKTTNDDTKGQWVVAGFDTEFAQDGTTISYQLDVEQKANRLIRGPGKRSIRDICDAFQQLSIKACGDKPEKVVVAAYYNTAELSQFSRPFWEEPGVTFYQVHPNGLYHVEIEHKETFFLFYDLWHFFASMKNSSLYAIAEKFGEEKIEYDVTDLTLAALDDPEFVRYALNDARLCVSIFRKLDTTYLETNGVSITTRPTPANAAQASFKLNYLREDIAAPNTFVRRLALKANWAGRVECGYLGLAEGVHEFDADSLYPRSTLLLPGLPGPRDWKIGRLPSRLDEIEGFCEVEFEFPDYEEWPCLPVWTGTSLCFPLRGITRCTIGELRSALLRGVQYRQLGHAAFYERGSHEEFHKFLQDNIKFKEENDDDEAKRAVAKLNMNASIGKFIQNRGGMDYGEACKWAQENINKYPSEILNLVFCGLSGRDIPDFRQESRLGSSFYPEWHTLILGKAREVMANAIFNCPSYPKILMISTDSLHIKGSKMGSSEVKFKHEYGPATFKSLRERVHASWVDGKLKKIAHHGIPMKDAEVLIHAGGEVATIFLKVSGKKTIRESIMTSDVFAAKKTRNIAIDTMLHTNKRRVDGTGWTHPLTSIAL